METRGRQLGGPWGGSSVGGGGVRASECLGEGVIGGLREKESE